MGPIENDISQDIGNKIKALKEKSHSIAAGLKSASKLPGSKGCVKSSNSKKPRVTPDYLRIPGAYASGIYSSQQKYNIAPEGEPSIYYTPEYIESEQLISISQKVLNFRKKLDLEEQKTLLDSIHTLEVKQKLAMGAERTKQSGPPRKHPKTAEEFENAFRRMSIKPKDRAKRITNTLMQSTATTSLLGKRKRDIDENERGIDEDQVVEEDINPWMKSLGRKLSKYVWRVWDPSSKSQILTPEEGFLSQAPWAPMYIFADRKLQVTRHASFKNRHATPLISTTSSFDAALDTHAKRLNARQIKNHKVRTPK
jgi:hypothetical protein